MAVRAVVLDLDGTLIDARGMAVSGIPEMMTDLRSMGMRLAVASNQPRAAQKRLRAGLDVDFIIDKAMMGDNKGSKRWVPRVQDEFGIERNELVWLGDSNRDMRAAVNTGVLYFNAGWSEPDYPYGINLATPYLLPLFLQEFFQKPLSWYWQFDGRDRQARSVLVKAMMDANGAGFLDLKSDLIAFLKEGGDPRVGVGPMRLRTFIFMHFVGSLFGDPFYRRVDTWTAYPSSRGGTNPALSALVTLVARLFKDRYFDDLLIRHTQSLDSGTSRRQQIQVTFSNQSNTIRVNQDHLRRIRGKHIVVIDDFATRGYSGECARQLLLEAGAAEVVCVNVCKYGPDYWTISRTDSNYTWNPCEAMDHPVHSFREMRTAGKNDPSVLTMIRESYRRVGAWRQQQ